MPKWQGKKAGGTHTTLIEAALDLVKVAAGLPNVTKISLGYITPTPGKTGFRRVRFRRINGGLLATVRGNTAIQEIYIYTDQPGEVQRVLEQVPI